jgi:hypothetical protein
MSVFPICSAIQYKRFRLCSYSYSAQRYSSSYSEFRFEYEDEYAYEYDSALIDACRYRLPPMDSNRNQRANGPLQHDLKLLDEINGVVTELSLAHAFISQILFAIDDGVLFWGVGQKNLIDGLVASLMVGAGFFEMDD